jgi:uncharacterized protein
MPRTRLLVVQPTPFCNINCSYCYLPDRSSKAVVEHTTLWNLFWQLFASGWVRDRLDVVWHAGEPMVLPIDFYRQALRMIDRMRPPALRVLHHLQTNATLINDEWCEFFLREQIRVGVSVDGPQHINDLHRVTRSGRGTFARTIAGIRLLRRRKVPFHVISVISRASMASARELFDFYVAEGIEQVAFNVEDSVNQHVSGVLTNPDSAAAYRKFLGEFWALAGTREQIRAIREIDDMIDAISLPPRTGLKSEMAEHSPPNCSASGMSSTGIFFSGTSTATGWWTFRATRRSPECWRTSRLGWRCAGTGALISTCAAAVNRPTSWPRTALLPAPRPVRAD